MKRFCILSFLTLFALMLPGRSLSDTLVLRDGTRISGVLVKRTATMVTFKNSHGVVHRYKASEVENVERTLVQNRDGNQDTYGGANTYGAPSGHSASSNDHQPEVLPQGTQLVIRTNEDIDSKTASPNQHFCAQIDEDVRDNANAPSGRRGSPVQLIIRTVSSGGTAGTPDIVLDIHSITVGGRRYLVSTTALHQKGRSGLGANKRTAEMVGGGAVAGTIIGAIIGHGKGAAIGAAVGAAGGAAAQVLTKGKEVRIPAKTVLKFKLDQPVTLAPER